MKSIIFLDIDGVLNQLQPNYYLDDRCIRVLSDIVSMSKSEIVLISSWRLGYTPSYDKCTPQVKDLIARLNKNNIKIKSITKKLSDKTTEIQTYIKENNVDRYIILDDNINDYSNRDRLYIVDSITGLVGSDTRKIVKQLKQS